MKTLFKLSVITGTIGLLLIFSVVLSKSGHPDMFFQVGTSLGLLLVFCSVILGLVSWLLYLKDLIKKKEYVWVTIVSVLGLFVIIKALIRLI